MKIEERTVGDVTVLDVNGMIVIGEGDDLLVDSIDALAAKGRTKIVLNLANMPYVDSSGLQALVRAYIILRRRGGKVKLLHPVAKIRDLFSITKLLTVFETYTSEDDAVAACHYERLQAACVVCHGNARSIDVITQLHCSECGAWFGVNPTFMSRLASIDHGPGTRSEEMCSVEQFSIPSHHGQSVRVVMNQPTAIHVTRLDLFASESVSKAWQTIPSPRRILFNLEPWSRGDLTERGLEAVRELCGHKDDDSRAVVWVHSWNEETWESLPDRPPFYRSKEAALTALGPIASSSAALRVAIRIE